MNNPGKLAIIVPCYNEQEVLPETEKQLTAFLQTLINENLAAADSKVCFVNDGSRDLTWPMIKRFATDNPLVEGVNLTRNFGHQGALLAGLNTAQADIYVSIDADLQDDHTVIREMLKKYYAGNDIVLGVRNCRDTDSFFKRSTANMFYRLMTLLGVKIVENHADFRLMSKRAVDTLKEFGEHNLFLRGIVPLLGYDTAQVFYARKERTAGESKYPLRKMLAFAWDGITSFSVVPLRLAAIAGALTVVFSMILMIKFLYAYFMQNAVPGWTSTVAFVGLLGGAQLLVIAILGEYVGKIYLETKARPLYIVREHLNR